MDPSHRTPGIGSGLALALLACAAPAGAESSLILPIPSQFEEIAATTYDQDTGATLGGGFIRLERDDETGRVRMEASSGIDGGASTRLVAEFASLEDGSGLRLLRQESRSVDVTGQPMGTLEIDHLAGEGRCTDPARDGKPPRTRTVTLPEGDRLVNVPLNLLFQPIVSGELQEMRFQLLLCGGGPRIVTAVARVADGLSNLPSSSGLVRIQYELSLPKMLSRVVARWLPHLSFWFDPGDAGSWIGNQMPLYSKGPTVLVVRRGITPTLLQSFR